MARLNINDARCEAVFASGLQRSDAPTAEAVAQVISRTMRQLGTRGCAAQMAQEFGPGALRGAGGGVGFRRVGASPGG
jgi:hypothetical protein